MRYPISGSLEVDKCQWLGSIIPQDSNVNSTVDGMGVLSYDKVVVISILPNRGWKIDRLLACRLVDLHRVAATVVTGEGLQILVCSVVEPCNRQDAFAAARPDIKTDIEKKR